MNGHDTKLAGANTLDSNGFGALRGGREVLLGRVEGSVEEGVDESGFSQARLAWEGGKGDKKVKLKWCDSANAPTTMAVNWKPFLTLFLWTWLGRFANPT